VDMTFQKYFGKKTKFMIVTIIMPIILIFLKAGCQPKFYVQYTCTPQFIAIADIILYFILFSFVIWPVIGLYSLVKFIRTRKIRNTIND